MPLIASGHIGGPCISPMSSTYLPTSPLSSPLYLRHISPGTRKDGSDADLRFDLPTNFQGGIADPYFAGKLLAKMAYIATIANTSAVGLGKEAAKLLPKLKQYLEVWRRPNPNPSP